MPVAFLLAMMAAGAIVDWFGKAEQARLSKMGAQIEQAGIEADIETTRLQTEEQGLAEMKQLRKNLGSQAALFAARGVQGGSGTAALFSNESMANFNADERMRMINQKGNEARLKANIVLSKLHQTATNKSIWNEFAKNTLGSIPTSPEAWKGVFGGGSGTAASSGFGNGFRTGGSGFGFTPVGGG